MLVVEVTVTDGDHPYHSMTTEVQIPKDVVADTGDHFMDFVGSRVKLDWAEWVSNGYMWKE